MNPVLDIQGVSHSYGPRTALNNASFSVLGGRVTMWDRHRLMRPLQHSPANRWRHDMAPRPAGAPGISGARIATFHTAAGTLRGGLVRPLMWLFVFAAGFRAALGLSIAPPYETYITYETYIVPGLAGMIQLFNGMQSSLSMVYDREMGSMRVLLSSQTLYWLCALNPFTHVVESIRFALYAQFNALSLAATAITLAVFAVLAVLGYDPRHGMIKRQVA
jgi:hypothetical protein